jgi:hypothetical protein
MKSARAEYFGRIAGRQLFAIQSGTATDEVEVPATRFRNFVLDSGTWLQVSDVHGDILMDRHARVAGHSCRPENPQQRVAPVIQRVLALLDSWFQAWRVRQHPHLDELYGLGL